MGVNDERRYDTTHRTPTGHTPNVWTCQNPECGDTLTADTIGRGGPGEHATLFCTSCSSRDVRLIEMKHPLFNAENFDPQEYPADGVADYVSYYDKLQRRS